MRYYMPTKVIEDKDVIKKNGKIFKEFGKKALIVTGRNSAKINGALKDLREELEAQEIDYKVFDQVVENPPVSNVEEGAKVGRGCDFIIGIGGGSPIDAAKAIGVLLENGSEDAYSKLLETPMLSSVPIIAIPTTAGTGTETTPYAIVTDHKKKTKSNFSARIFPVYALIDVKYFMTMPVHVRRNTCVDALTHLVESYMNVNATVYTEYIALEGIRLWGTVKESLLNEVISEEAMSTLINASTLAGMAIAQTGTSLPHGMGYALTYNHQIAHGKANGLLMCAYLDMCKNRSKVQRILENLNFENLKELAGFLQKLLGRLELSDEAISLYAREMMRNAGKLKNHPEQVVLEDLIAIYKKSVMGELDD